jgi:hypothetical protein
MIKSRCQRIESDHRRSPKFEDKLATSEAIRAILQKESRTTKINVDSLHSKSPPLKQREAMIMNEWRIGKLDGSH